MCARGWLILPDLLTKVSPNSMKSCKKARFLVNRNATGLVDFSRLAREWAARINKTRQKHGVFASIEMLEGLLIFPDWHANGLPESIKPGKNTAFPLQSKCLTHSATEKSTSPGGIPLRKNQHALDAFRYGKINEALATSVGWLVGVAEAAIELEGLRGGGRRWSPASGWARFRWICIYGLE